MAASSLDYKMIFLLVVYFFVTTHAIYTPTPLETVCNKTRHIEFCLNAFGSDPATRTASLPKLAQIAIVGATDKATNTKADISKRLFFTTDTKQRIVLIQCLHAYDDALAALQIAPEDLQKARYTDLYRHARDAAGGAVACEHAFINSSLPSPLKTANMRLGDWGNIIEVIALRLVK